MKTPTDQELNIAMAEWMGRYKIYGAEIYEWEWMNKNGSGCNYLPNYLSDDSPRRLLNEAEDKLGELIEPYLDRLAELPAPLYDVRATARQRTIAILKTVKPEMFQQ